MVSTSTGVHVFFGRAFGYREITSFRIRHRSQKKNTCSWNGTEKGLASYSWRPGSPAMELYGAVSPAAAARPQPGASWGRQLGYAAAATVGACGLVALLALASSTSPAGSGAGAQAAALHARLHHSQLHGSTVQQLQLHSGKAAAKAPAKAMQMLDPEPAAGASAGAPDGVNYARACGAQSNQACPASQSATYPAAAIAERAVDNTGAAGTLTIDQCASTGDACECCAVLAPAATACHRAGQVACGVR
jgi:hypothetical protein